MQRQRDTATLQERVINAVLADLPERTRGEIAAVAGVNPSQVSHWCDPSDTGRQMRLPELVALVRRYGADVVLAPLAALSGCVVVRPDPSARGCAATLRRCLWAAMGHVEDATADGAWSREEALAALPSLEAAHAEMTRMLDEARTAARGRVA